jgi:hypothetical protein
MTSLVQIKLLHTVVWFFFAGCIVALPVVGGLGHYRWAAVLIGLVLVECGVLAANRGRCPLTGMAARHTEQRSANFDIYLPLWLARHNKTIFGPDMSLYRHRARAVDRAADRRLASGHNPARLAGVDHRTTGHECSTACRG